MLDYFLRNKAERMLVLCLSPLALILLYPLSSFYGRLEELGIFMAVVACLSVSCYYYISIVIGRNLIAKNKEEYSCVGLRSFTIHTCANLLFIFLLPFVTYLYEINHHRFNYLILFYLLFAISGIIRLKNIAKLMVCLELKRDVKLKDYAYTLYLLVNPVLGMWNLHSRLKIIFQK